MLEIQQWKLFIFILTLIMWRTLWFFYAVCSLQVRARALHCSSPCSFPWILAWKPETPMLLSLGGRCFNSVIALYSRYSWSIESLSAGGSKSAGKSKSKKILKLEILTYGGVASERDFWNYWQFSCTKQSKVFIDWYWQFTLFYRKDNQELRPLDA